MPADTRISPEIGYGPQRSGQGHFIIQVMNAVMAQPTEVNPLQSFCALIVFSKIRPAMELSGDQMVKTEGGAAAAKGAASLAAPGVTAVFDMTRLGAHLDFIRCRLTAC